MKPMRSPAGLKRGWLSLSPQEVKRRGWPPSVESSHRLLEDLLSSIEYDVTAATACDPSGDRLGAPNLSSRHRCSTVKRTFFRVRVLAVACAFMTQRLRASWKSRWVRTTGHSAAVML